MLAAGENLALVLFFVGVFIGGVVGASLQWTLDRDWRRRL